MSVADGDILRVAATFSTGRGSVLQNIYHYKYSGAGDTDEEVGDEIKADLTEIYTNIEAELDNNVESSEVAVWLWDTVEKVFNGIYSEDWTDITGGTSAVALPDGTCALVRILTALPRRQGRKFLGVFPVGQYTEAGWTAALLVDLALLVADIFDSRATQNGSVQTGLFNTTSESFISFKNAGILNAFASYQRRRRPGVGE